MKRTTLVRRAPLRPNSYAEAVERLRRKAPRKPFDRKPRATLNHGRKTREWQAVWRELKPRFERAGITFCEIGGERCLGALYLTPAHSLKRRNITTPEKLREVIIACVHCHSEIEMLREEEMERRVCEVIAERPHPI